MKNHMGTLSCALVALLCCPVTASPDNRGTDFIMTFLPAPDYGFWNLVGLYLTSEVSTAVTVEYPVNSPTFTTTVNVGPGAVTVVSLPEEARSAWTPGTVQNNAVHAFADDEFACYMINRSIASTDAALALPVDAMGTQYVAMGYTALYTEGTYSCFAVVAAYDNTTVTITPAAALVGNHPAGVPFQVSLDQGEAFLGKDSGGDPAGDVTGSIIQTDQPVGVTNGHELAFVPGGTEWADHIFEVAQPAPTWGTRVLVANLPDRPSGSVYRILAAIDNTEVSQDGQLVDTIDRGEFIEVGPVAGDHEFTANNPIFVVQFMTGIMSSGATTGDPAMCNMIPTEQYLSNYTFSTMADTEFSDHWVTVIAADADVGTLELNDVPIAAGEFTPIGATGYSVARIPLADGTYTTESFAAGHGITVEGYRHVESYLYPGGVQYPVEDCNTNGIPDTWDVASGTSEDLNGNGIPDECEVSLSIIVDLDKFTGWCVSFSDCLDEIGEPFGAGAVAIARETKHGDPPDYDAVFNGLLAELESLGYNGEVCLAGANDAGVAFVGVASPTTCVDIEAVLVVDPDIAVEIVECDYGTNANPGVCPDMLRGIGTPVVYCDGTGEDCNANESPDVCDIAACDPLVFSVEVFVSEEYIGFYDCFDIENVGDPFLAAAYGLSYEECDNEEVEDDLVAYLTANGYDGDVSTEVDENNATVAFYGSGPDTYDALVTAVNDDPVESAEILSYATCEDGDPEVVGSGEITIGNGPPCP